MSLYDCSPSEGVGLSFAAFNIQNYGRTKDQRPVTREVTAEIIGRYDILGMEELSQKPPDAETCQPDGTGCGGPQHTDESNDEQYTLFYDRAKASFVEGDEYPDTNGYYARTYVSGETHNRIPYAFLLRVPSGAGADCAAGVSCDATFAIALTHTNPDRAEEEIRNFGNVLSWMEGRFGADFNMIAGLPHYLVCVEKFT
ncbi:hypothetical protein EMIHUDRAFT_256176 [Emiliania huxleyi CCMP1516]|uniref:Uncharacterized protein n=2 Tax=Emiliania huxleyi TaxID=2903 RepID=A0A0D3IYZ1_EMIH1|nr:hypothetical protein EMIHUDRAFT_256176 [Emiliania huxleyi CCMP1516]EOD16476.1 hypothetical protein EMIHUDRAFT_256176 [Emiliania huxleyi CCMP1516]|eukprot:XP_005768905.1 hypothetical protein EMIHUDRAFT_256176 [Emiliania huxleyi CCMP1516]